LDTKYTTIYTVQGKTKVIVIILLLYIHKRIGGEEGGTNSSYGHR